MNEAALHARIKAGTKRIEKVDLEGRVFWIKRPEELGLRMRLQKGDPKRAFAAEVAAHQALAAKGLPVPPIVATGDGYIVTEDCGLNLRWQLRKNPDAMTEMLRDAATALAKVHAAGEAHGRPNLKDICWDAGRVTFLDFERTGRDGDMARAQEMDVLIFLFSIATATGGSTDAMETARAAYSAHQPELWAKAQTRLRRYLPLRWLLSPITWALRNKPEFGAVAPLFRFMLG